MNKKGLINVIYIKYALYRGFVSAFFCLSVCQSVSQLFVLRLVLLPNLPPDMHCTGALSMRSFVCLSVCQLVHPLVLWLDLLPVLPPDGCIVVCLSDLLIRIKQLYVCFVTKLRSDVCNTNRYSFLLQIAKSWYPKNEFAYNCTIL